MKIDGFIATAGAAQPIALDPTATKQLTFRNGSADRLIIAIDGYPASPTHGLVVESASSIAFDANAQDGLAFPTGQLSVWGPAWGAPFSVITT
jgi:hypothetical protein